MLFLDAHLNDYLKLPPAMFGDLVRGFRQFPCGICKASMQRKNYLQADADSVSSAVM